MSSGVNNNNKTVMLQVNNQPQQFQEQPAAVVVQQQPMYHAVAAEVQQPPPQQQQQQQQTYSAQPQPPPEAKPVVVTSTAATVTPGQQVLNQFQVDASLTPAAAKPLHVQKLQQYLDLNPFLDQLEQLLASPIRIPNRSLIATGSGQTQRPPRSVFSVNGIWATQQDKHKATSNLYNFKTGEKRKWLQDILLEESDSDSDGEQNFTDTDIKILLKLHKCRRKYQKKYHTDILNSQYTYYCSGLLSEHDRFPEHQAYVIDQYGFGCDKAELSTLDDPQPCSSSTQQLQTLSMQQPQQQQPMLAHRAAPPPVPPPPPPQQQQQQPVSSTSSMNVCSSIESVIAQSVRHRSNN